MTCPDCGGAMWDNRETKKSPKQPDYKCKNKSCDKAIWLKTKAENAAAPAANGKPPVSGAPLAMVYGECMEIASRAVKHYIGESATAADVIAATATLFIGATQTGRPVKALPKPKPAPPPPPPPKPEPVYEEETIIDEYGQELPF